MPQHTQSRPAFSTPHPDPVLVLTEPGPDGRLLYASTFTAQADLLATQSEIDVFLRGDVGTSASRAWALAA